MVSPTCHDSSGPCAESLFSHAAFSGTGPAPGFEPLDAQQLPLGIWAASSCFQLCTEQHVSTHQPEPACYCTCCVCSSLREEGSCMSYYHILTQPDTVLAAVQGQEREEVATSPTPGLAPTKNIAPNK